MNIPRAHIRKILVAPMLCIVLLLTGFLIEITPPSLAQELPPDENTGEETRGEGKLNAEYVTGYVISVKAAPSEENPAFKSPVGTMDRVENVVVKMTSGEWSGRTVTVVNHLSGHPAFDVNVEPGASVVLVVERIPGQLPDINLADRDRTPILNLFLGLVLLGTLLVAGRPGLVSLGLTGLALFSLNQWVLPSIFAGDIASLSMACLLAIIVVLASQLWILDPHTRRITLLGTTASAGVAMATMEIIALSAPLKGFSSEALASLWQLNPNIDFQGLLVSGVLLGHTGLIFYLVKQMAEQLTEPGKFSQLEESMPFYKRFFAAISEGRQTLASLMMGLIFLYLGFYFPLLLETTDVAVEKFINLESTATILASALSGCMGLLCALPITAALVAYEAGKEMKPELKPGN